MKYLITALLMLFVAACGSDVPPPQEYQQPVPQPQQQQQDLAQPRQLEPGYSAEFDRLFRQTRTAVRGLSANLNADTFAEAGALVYRTLAVRVKHEREGYDLSLLRNLTEMNRLRTDWKNFEGRLTHEERSAYKEHPEYAAAFRAYQELGGN